MAPRVSGEHPVPINYIKNKLIEYIEDKDINSINKFLNFIVNNTHQVFLTYEEDNRVNKLFRTEIPSNWDWTMDNPYQRYVEADIRKDLW